MTIELLITIGKILGFTILGIVGLVILLLLLVLFVPIRYRIIGMKEQETFVKVKATWLFHIVSVLVSFQNMEEGLVRSVRVFGLPIGRRKAPKRPKEKMPDNKRTGDTGSNEQNGDTPSCDVPLDSGKAISWESKREDTKANQAHSNMHNNKKSESKKPGLLSKIKQKWISFLDFCKSIKNKKEHYEKILHSDTFQRAFALCKAELLKAWIHVRPRKIAGNVCFGFEDPSVTGRVLGGICMLYAFYGNALTVIPDFERKIFEGKLDIRGRIRVLTVLLVAIRLYKDKDIKRLRGMLKKEDN